MDIDDLLAEVAVDSTPQETRDLQELTRSWVGERVAPEILPWPTELMQRVLERIRLQVSPSMLQERPWLRSNSSGNGEPGADDQG